MRHRGHVCDPALPAISKASTQLAYAVDVPISQPHTSLSAYSSMEKAKSPVPCFSAFAAKVKTRSSRPTCKNEHSQRRSCSGRSSHLRPQVAWWISLLIPCHAHQRHDLYVDVSSYVDEGVGREDEVQGGAVGHRQRVMHILHLPREHPKDLHYHPWPQLHRISAAKQAP